MSDMLRLPIFDLSMFDKKMETPKPMITIPDPVAVQKRCQCCKKKLMLTDMACGKCKNRYCSTHRLPEEHSCCYDFKEAGRAHLAKENPKVVADKMGDRV